MPWAVGLTEDQVRAFNREAESNWREGRGYDLADNGLDGSYGPFAT